MADKITKAVFPVAGLGTRFLPATKANPKEMLPVVDKPLIQYAVEEAINAGVTELIFVTSSSKRAIEDHFDTNFELEYSLEQNNKQNLLQLVQNIVPTGVNCIYVRQPQALGLGHAVLCAEKVVGNEPFAVLLADDLIDAPTGCLSQMLNLYAKHQDSVIAVERIQAKDTEKYGVIDVSKDFRGEGVVDAIVEKPRSDVAPSLLGVVGRYILDPDIFNNLRTIPKGAGGEIQLTDAIQSLLTGKKVRALEFSGTRYDCGSKLGYLQATLALGLKHPELGSPLRKYILDDLVNEQQELAL